MKDRIRVRVLLIDDDESVRRRLLHWLEEEAYEVVQCGDGASGIAAFEQDEFELALVDLVLPDLRGIDILKGFRAASRTIGLLALAAFTNPEQAQAALTLNAILLEKPIERSALLSAIESASAQVGVTARTEDAFNRRLGERLRLLRTQTGITQRDAARKAGVTPAQLSQIESGKTATSTWTLARIAAALRTPLYRIFEDERKK